MGSREWSADMDIQDNDDCDWGVDMRINATFLYR